MVKHNVGASEVNIHTRFDGNGKDYAIFGCGVSRYRGNRTYGGYAL